MPRVIAALALTALLLGSFLAASASAVAPSKASVTLYSFPRVPPTGGTGPLAVDQRGSVWFDQTYEEPPEGPGDSPGFPGQIVRMNRQGEIAVVAQRMRPSGLAVGPDGSVWFTGFREIGRIAPDGSVSTLPLPFEEEPGGKVVFDDGPLVIGADGNVWFSGARGIRDEEGAVVGSQPIIGRLAPGGGLSEFDLPLEGGHPIRLALGPDGNVWFTEALAARVGRITPAGLIQHFPLPPPLSEPSGIGAGLDGALWFKAAFEDRPAIARITTSGAVTAFPLPAGGRVEEPGGLLGPSAVVAGPDGRVWFVAEAGAMGRIGPSGLISKVPIPTRFPEDIAVGPEGSVWYTSAAGPPCLPGDSVCGDGGYYQSGVIGRVDPAPLSVQIEGGKPAARGHRVKLRLTCLDGRAEQVCRGRLRLRAGGKVVAKRRYALGTDRSRAASVRLSRGARSKLARSGRLHLKVTATLSGGRKTTEAIRLRLPRR